ncbi:MAG: RNA polymerase sigma factor [Geodermatophilaceae bacterium]
MNDSLPVSPPSVDGMSTLHAATDAQLLQGAAAGDANAFDAVYRRHAAVIRGRLRRRCADPELVEEVLQDTFLAVWRGAAGWNGSGEVQAWIWGIAVHRLAGALRARLGRPCPEITPDLPAPSAEDEVLRDVQYGDVWAAVSTLTPELRQVVRATILLQLTTHETAGLLGIPQGTVKTRMMRARQRLRQHIDQKIDGV